MAKYEIKGDVEQDDDEQIVDETGAEDEELELEVDETEDDEKSGTEEQEEIDEENVDEENVDEENVDDNNEGEVDITLEGEEPDEEQAAPGWVKDLRRKHREDAKRIKELEAENASLKKPESTLTLGSKPTLEACDYDEDEFDKQLSAWYDRKRQIDAKEKEAEEAQKAQQKAWNTKLENYEKSKKELKFSGFDEAEENVKNFLNIAQQGAIIQGAKNPAALVAVIGKDPKRCAELAKIEDPVEFIFAIAHLEAKLKVTRKSMPATKPEKRVKVPAHNAKSASQQLERLREEAEKTGDYTKVTAFKRQMKQAG